MQIFLWINSITQSCCIFSKATEAKGFRVEDHTRALFLKQQNHGKIRKAKAQGERRCPSPTPEWEEWAPNEWQLWRSLGRDKTDNSQTLLQTRAASREVKRLVHIAQQLWQLAQAGCAEKATKLMFVILPEKDLAVVSTHLEAISRRNVMSQRVVVHSHNLSKSLDTECLSL